MGFKITSGHGFHITFQNGYTISVQFGPSNYCENRNSNLTEFARRNPNKDEYQSPNAEVAIWDVNGTWVTKRAVTEIMDDTLDDSVIGWLPADAVGKLIEWTRKASPVIEKSAEERLLELAQYIKDHPQAAQGMGDRPHGEWVTLQNMAKQILDRKE